MTSLLRFDDRVIVITGSSRGMGRAHALLLAERGASIVVNGVTPAAPGCRSGADAVVDTIAHRGGSAVAYIADVGTVAGARGAVECALDTFGRVDGIVHNAGFTRPLATFGGQTEEGLEQLLAVNTWAAFRLCRAAWPHFTQQRFGRVVLIGSSGMYGAPENVSYSTAKASFIGLTRTLALDGAADNIRVNAVCPSASTDMSAGMAESPFKTWFETTMRPELVSPAIGYLLHADCELSGELLRVGGGRVARIVLAENRGYVDPGMTIETLRDHLSDVMSAADMEPVGTLAAAWARSMSELGFRPTT